MSEKHDPTGDAASHDEAGSVGDPNPFAISPAELSSPKDVPSFQRSGASASDTDATPPDLLDENASRPAESQAAPALPPEEVDAGVEELQARPADIGGRRAEPESPKTIVSQVDPSWPTWSDGNLPPLIIYGPTSFRRSPASVPLEPRPPAAEPTPTPGAAEETIPPVEPVDPAVSETPAAASSAEPQVEWEPAAPPQPSGVTETPTLPADATVPVESEELDEIFDSIEAIAAPEPTGTNEPPAAPAWAGPATLMGDVPNLPHDPPPNQSGPATMSGAWPPPSEPGTPLTMGPATMSGQWPPAPATEDLAARDDDGPPSLVEPSADQWKPASSGPLTMDTTTTDLPPIDIDDQLRADDLEPALVDELPPEEPAEPLAVAETVAIEEPGALESGVLEPVPEAVEPASVEAGPPPLEPAVVPIAAVAAGVGAGAASLAAKDDAQVPIAETGYAHDASHGQTASEFFAHAHEDVDQRRGILSLGLLTKLSGLSGLLACMAGLAILLLACAGMTPFTSEHVGLLAYGAYWGAICVGGFGVLLLAGSFLFKSWRPSATFAIVLGALMGVGCFALQQYHGHVAGFNLLSITNYLTYTGLGGLALGLLGGFIEHRRLREETHVLAALFSNVLASAGGGLLWWMATGATLMGK